MQAFEILDCALELFRHGAKCKEKREEMKDP
jgi:hypothetical protein